MMGSTIERYKRATKTLDNTSIPLLRKGSKKHVTVHPHKQINRALKRTVHQEPLYTVHIGIYTYAASVLTS
jgi:hypothetical protein